MNENIKPDSESQANEPQDVNDDDLENATGGVSSPTPKPGVFIPFDASF